MTDRGGAPTRTTLVPSSQGRRPQVRGGQRPILEVLRGGPDVRTTPCLQDRPDRIPGRRAGRRRLLPPSRAALRHRLCGLAARRPDLCRLSGVAARAVLADPDQRRRQVNATTRDPPRAFRVGTKISGQGLVRSAGPDGGGRAWPRGRAGVSTPSRSSPRRPVSVRGEPAPLEVITVAVRWPRSFTGRLWWPPIRLVGGRRVRSSRIARPGSPGSPVPVVGFGDGVSG